MNIAIVEMISLIAGFLHPLLNLGPQIGPNRIVGRLGFPVTFWEVTRKRSPMKDLGRTTTKLINPDELFTMAKNKICSFPCQRVSHFIKLEDILYKKGVDKNFLRTRLASNNEYIDVGKCVGSCRKNIAENFKVS